jgi:hypothetical protein
LVVLELLEGLSFVLGGSGCGLSITLDPGDATEPDLEFLPETMMIDLSLPGCFGPTAEDCAKTVFEAICLAS